MIGSSRLLVLRLLLRSLNLLVGLVQALTRVVDEAVSSSSSRSDQVAAKRALFQSAVGVEYRREPFGFRGKIWQHTKWEAVKGATSYASNKNATEISRSVSEPQNP